MSRSIMASIESCWALMVNGSRRQSSREAFRIAGVYTGVPQARDTHTKETRISSALGGRLREAEPVAGVVAEDGFDAVRALGRFGNKPHAFGFHFFVGAAAVVGVEDAC